MCGGYELEADPEALVRAFRVDRQLELPLEARAVEHYPRGLSPLIVERAGERLLGAARWGLIPRWARDPSIGERLYNARCETLQDKPAFRDSFARRRCIVPVTAFYEWHGPKGNKQRVRFAEPSGGLLALAGLWDRWRAADGEEVGSFTVVTTDANRAVSPYHPRMPVVLDARDAAAWLHPRCDAEALLALLLPYAGELTVRRPG